MSPPPYITKQQLDAFIESALKEDIGDGDHSSLAAVPKEVKAVGKLTAKQNGILAGSELAQKIFESVDVNLTIKSVFNDGDSFKTGDQLLTVEGNARSVLAAERLALNCMQRMSGIATYTKKLTALICHTKAKLLDTRKTTPNFRLPEKWAVHIGGGVNHRFGLYDMIMLKDNHIACAGGIENAIQSTKKYLNNLGTPLKIEIETENIDQIKEVIAVGGVDRIMLDNMPPEKMKIAVELIAGRFETEASGGITETTIAAVAESGVDFISVGALTHSTRSIDMSLKTFLIS